MAFQTPREAGGAFIPRQVRSMPGGQAACPASPHLAVPAERWLCYRGTAQLLQHLLPSPSGEPKGVLFHGTIKKENSGKFRLQLIAPQNSFPNAQLTQQVTSSGHGQPGQGTHKPPPAPRRRKKRKRKRRKRRSGLGEATSKAIPPAAPPGTAELQMPATAARPGFCSAPLSDPLLLSAL